MKFELVLLSAAFFSAATGQDDWGYGTTDGPSTWPARYPQCGGVGQSPIALDSNTAYRSRESPFDWCETYDNEPSSMTLTNTGHTVSLKGVWDVPPCILMDGCKYSLDNIQWHWKSEHTIGGVRFPLEMHMVFTTQGNPSQNTVVFAHMYTESGSSPKTPGLVEVVDNIPFVRDVNTSTDVNPFPISVLRTGKVKPVFMYKGSLTTPPCNKTVVWIVEDEPSGVISSQLSTFRTLRDKEGNTVQKNYRPLQPINCRTVSYYLNN